MEGMAVVQTVRYRRATAVFDERVKERLWGSSSSGSDRSASFSPDLADLVDSFYSDDGGDEGDASTLDARRKGEFGSGAMGENDKQVLEGLVAVGGRDLVGRKIRQEAEAALRSFGTAAVEEDGLKRRIMWWLRERGFDAGLCKSRPDENNCRFHSGGGYVDVIANGGTRYIVELNLAVEFEIARPTSYYADLLLTFPAIFVGRQDGLREIVKMMCAAAKESMSSRDMHLPPWRRREYMLAKWLEPCKRTTNRISKSSVGGGQEGGSREEDREVAAAAEVKGVGGGKYCRVEFGRRDGLEKRRFGMGFMGM